MRARLGERRGDAAARPTRSRRPSTSGERDRAAGEQAAQQHAELVGGARDVGHDAPVRAKLGPVEQPERRLGVPDVEGQEHGSGSAKVRDAGAVPRDAAVADADEQLARRRDAINDAS